MGTTSVERPLPDPSATARARARYDRLAPRYDRIEGLMEARAAIRWRELLWQRVRGPRVLEIGVGTGKNIRCYPAGAEVTAIDFSPRMLERAEQVAVPDGVSLTLRLADAQALPFPDASFDAVAATFVFCSVPDPVLGLREARRVLAPGGQLLLLEHMLSAHRMLRPAMRLLNPLVVRVMGANIDRETLASVRLAGFTIARVDDLMLDVVKLVEAR